MTPQHMTPIHWMLVAVLGMMSWGLSSSAGAETYVISLDPSKSQVTFLLGATGHSVRGTLHLKSGTLHLDPASGKASGQVVLDAARSETGNARRDKKMHQEVLLSSKHPLIVFDAQQMTGEVTAPGAVDFESDVEIVGTMTLAGSQHPVTLAIHIDVEGTSLRGHCTLTVPFVQWGLSDPSVLFLRVDKEVQVTVDAVGQWAVQDVSSEKTADEAKSPDVLR